MACLPAVDGVGKERRSKKLRLEQMVADAPGRVKPPKWDEPLQCYLERPGMSVRSAKQSRSDRLVGFRCGVDLRWSGCWCWGEPRGLAFDSKKETHSKAAKNKNFLNGYRLEYTLFGRRRFSWRRKNR